MKTGNVLLHERVGKKAQALGLWDEALVCALDILSQNRNLVNALDNRNEMDEYIYRAIIKAATERRKVAAEAALNSDDPVAVAQAEKDLSMLSREELTTDPYYRAILPLLAKMVVNEPILRLHADEASEIIIKLADFKRRHRVTSLTEVIVTQCKEELNDFSDSANVFQPADS